MYWLREFNSFNLLLCFSSGLSWSFGGYFLITRLFSLNKRETPLLSFGVGLVLYLWLANILGHFLAPYLAFLLPSPLILIAGLVVRKTSPQPHKKIPLKEFLIQAGIFTILVVFFTLIGRGLAIFDERKNLTLISLMANGDIPPHNPLNPETSYQYHYGSQLLGASLTKIGGFFPWSAFDISKSIFWALTVFLVYYIIRRRTQKELPAILLTGTYCLFSGTRYLLMLFPQGFLSALNEKITLLGSSQDIGLPFSQAIFADWIIGGGPPSAYPYGFINGILKPLIMAHSGTETFALAIVLMLWLLLSSQSKKPAVWIIAILFAHLALTWETTYILLAIAGILYAGIHYITHRQKEEKNAILNMLMLAGVISIPLVLLQGGTIHEIGKNYLSTLLHSSPTINAAITEEGMFRFNFPPVIFSGHLGALSIFDPAQLLVGLCELGPSIFFIPPIWKWIKVQNKYGERIVLQIFFLSALIGLLIPAFLTYQSSARDITRFSAYGLAILNILFLFFIIESWKTQRVFVKIIEGISLGLMMVSGSVIGIVQLSAINKPVLTEGIDGWDARLSAQIWAALPDDAWVFDPSNYNWRASVISGNPTLISSPTLDQTQWERLRNTPRLEEFLQTGFEYIYIDEDWWAALEPEYRQELERECVQTIAELQDEESGVLRRLIMISNCD